MKERTFTVERSMSKDLKEVKRAKLFIYRNSVLGRENSKTKALRGK